jgi:hypothetical protein
MIRCQRCRLARRRANWTCRECTKLLCEHLVAFKRDDRSGMCTGCLMRQQSAQHKQDRYAADDA